jgi:hypothetical protein
MTAPIVIRNPIMSLVELIAGVPTGTPVDVSDDVSKVELTPTIPTTDVKTFSGVYQSSGDPTWVGKATIVVNEDTSSNWGPLIGKTVRAQLFDRGADTTRYRQFDTEILIDPTLGGPTEPGAARSYDLTLPISAPPTWVEP